MSHADVQSLLKLKPLYPSDVLDIIKRVPPREAEPQSLKIVGNNISEQPINNKSFEEAVIYPILRFSGVDQRLIRDVLGSHDEWLTHVFVHKMSFDADGFARFKSESLFSHQIPT